MDDSSDEEEKPQTKPFLYDLKPKRRKMPVHTGEDVASRMEQLQKSARLGRANEKWKHLGNWVIGTLDTAVLEEEEREEEDQQHDRQQRPVGSLDFSKISHLIEESNEARQRPIRFPKKLIDVSMFEQKAEAASPTLTKKATQEWKWKQKSIAELYGFMSENKSLVPDEKQDLFDKVDHRDNESKASDKTFEEVTKKAQEQEEFLSEVISYINEKDSYVHEPQFKQTIQDYLDLIEANDDSKGKTTECYKRVADGTKRVESLRKVIMEQSETPIARNNDSASDNIGKLDKQILQDLENPSKAVFKTKVPTNQVGKSKELKKKLETNNDIDEVKVLLPLPRNKIIHVAQSIETPKPEPKISNLQTKQTKQVSQRKPNKDIIDSADHYHSEDIPSAQERPHSDSFTALKNIMSMVRNSVVGQAFEQSRLIFTSQEMDLDKPEIVVENVNEIIHRGSCKDIRSKFESTLQDTASDEVDMRFPAVRSKSCANIRKKFEKLEESPSPERARAGQGRADIET